MKSTVCSIGSLELKNKILKGLSAQYGAWKKNKIFLIFYLKIITV